MTIYLLYAREVDYKPFTLQGRFETQHDAIHAANLFTTGPLHCWHTKVKAHEVSDYPHAWKYVTIPIEQTQSNAKDNTYDTI